MRQSGGISRRRFLYLLVFGYFSSIFPDRAFSDWSKRSNTELMALKLNEIINNKGSAHVIGSVYLNKFPHEAGLQLLVDLICKTEESYRAIMMARKSSLKKIILDMQQEDFSKGITVNLNGWILSHTEARLCALTSIL